MKRSRTSRRARVVSAAVIAVAVGVLASLGGVSYAARLLHVSHQSPTATEYPPAKVTICHHTHSQKNPFVTITVSEHAVPAHLGHGDTVGACSQQQGATEKAKTKGPKTERSAHQNRGHQGGKSHGHHSGKPSGAGAGSAHGNRGQGHGRGQGGVHGQGKGHGRGAQGHGQGQNHGQGHGQGGQGHGPGGSHGNSGGGPGNGNGRGHKP
jgi:hypothetical protein